MHDRCILTRLVPAWAAAVLACGALAGMTITSQAAPAAPPPTELNTQLSQRVATAGDTRRADPADGDRRPPLKLACEPASGPTQDPPGEMRDLLHFRISSDAALNFRPRGGGLMMTYHSRF